MFVSGFTFIRNAIKLDYPVREAILSILPLVDEMVVAVGASQDSTREVIAALGPKIKIIDTVWDDSLRQGGKVLADETNKAFAQISRKADWCFYIQGDECVHEKYHKEILDKMRQYKADRRVDGLLFDYQHFYGSYDFVGDSRSWYRHEIRIIRNNKDIQSWKDAQGFRLQNKKLRVKKIDAAIYHYGWVRHPKYQMAKQLEAHKLWHSDAEIAKKFDATTDFDYSQIDSIKRFDGTHPAVMKVRIAEMNWQFDRDPVNKKFGLKTSILYAIEKYTGWRVGEHRNFKII